VAVAALQAFFVPQSAQAALASLTLHPSAGLAQPAQPLSKHSIRQQLATVCSAYPDARPTRGNLKQAFNLLHSYSEEGATPP